MLSISMNGMMIVFMDNFQLKLRLSCVHYDDYGRNGVWEIA